MSRAAHNARLSGRLRWAWPLGLALLYSACSTVKIGNASRLKDDVYRSGAGRVYVDEEEEREIVVYRYEAGEAGAPLATYAKDGEMGTLPPPLMLRKNSFDLDLISVPIKLRFENAEMPPQLSANISAALFMGYRKDFHLIHYLGDPLGRQGRRVTNVGFSLGAISGFANTLINPSTTAFRQEREYDGVVWLYGLAAIVGKDNLTFGVAAGKDVLLDGNHARWVYRDRPWLGLTIGLNLN